MEKETLETTTNNRIYKILQKSHKVYCAICNKRAGVFNVYCGSINYKKQKNWKRFRKKQYKEKNNEN